MELTEEECLREIQGAMNNLKTMAQTIELTLGVMETFLHLFNKSRAINNSPNRPIRDTKLEVN